MGHESRLGLLGGTVRCWHGIPRGRPVSDVVPYSEVDWVPLVLSRSLLLGGRVDTAHEMHWLLSGELTDKVSGVFLFIEVELLVDVRYLVLQLAPLVELQLQEVYKLSS